MKTKLIFTFILSSIFIFTSKIKAQETTFDKGTVVLTVGYGLPDLNRISLRSSYNIYYDNTTVRGFGPLIFKGEYGIMKFKWGHSVGGGIIVGVNSTNVTYYYSNHLWTQTDRYTTITIGARGTYHFFNNDKIDCYANVGLGFNINTYNQTTTDPKGKNDSYFNKPSSVYEAITVGIRYYFSKNIGVYAEAGWDMHAPLQGGLAVKF